MLFMYNDGGNHWLFFVVSFETSTIEQYDSLAGQLSEAHVAIRDYFARFHSGKWKVHRKKCPLQLDGYNCGVYALINAAAVLLSKKLCETTTIDVVKARKWIQTALLSGRCPVVQFEKS